MASIRDVVVGVASRVFSPTGKKVGGSTVRRRRLELMRRTVTPDEGGGGGGRMARAVASQSMMSDEDHEGRGLLRQVKRKAYR